MSAQGQNVLGRVRSGDMRTASLADLVAIGFSRREEEMSMLMKADRGNFCSTLPT